MSEDAATLLEEFAARNSLNTVRLEKTFGSGKWWAYAGSESNETSAKWQVAGYGTTALEAVKMLVTRFEATGTKIKLFNGRGNYRDVAHYYVGAHSQAQAVSLLKRTGHHMMTLHELRNYYNEGAWGVAMHGIEAQIGVWAEMVNAPGTVKRLL